MSQILPRKVDGERAGAGENDQIIEDGDKANGGRGKRKTARQEEKLIVVNIEEEEHFHQDEHLVNQKVWTPTHQTSPS